VTAYVALLRAVNVSGTGKLPMAELRAIGEACGFANVRTYIASGNLLFDSDLGEQDLVSRVEQRLSDFFGKRVPVFVRSAAEMRTIADSNPFPDERGSRNMVHFLSTPPPADLMTQVRGLQGERIALGTREISVAYGEGIGTSKLVLPGLEAMTARNRNTVEELARRLEEGK
jgi:uncharacterized protein (DUF1697 family)